MVFLGARFMPSAKALGYVLIALTFAESSIAQLISRPGQYRSADGKCLAEVTVSGMGGFKELALFSGKGVSRSIRDVTGLAFIGESTLVYTVSPIYGKPGVFKYNCATRKITVLARPVTIDKGFPHGADYFELHSVENKRICYYYSMDVDTTDFYTFRREENLRCMSIQ